MKPEKDKGTNRKKAIIYCRVSSAAQVSKGDGLNSQASRCREYARYKGLRSRQCLSG